MGTWNDIKSFAHKAKQRTGELADIAAMYVKLATLNSKLDSQFKLLGKLTYRQLKADEPMAEKISETILAIDKTKLEIKIMKRKIEIAKAEHEAARQKDREAHDDAAVAEEIEDSYTKAEYLEKDEDDD